VNGPLAGVVRASAFIRKEAIEVLRQPRLLLLLVLGPFLVLLLFGAGLRDTDPPARTVFVVPEGSELTQSVTEFAAQQEGRVTVEGVVADEEQALRQLEDGRIDLVVAFPEEVSETVRQDQQAVITLYHAQMDPVEGRAIELFMQTAVDEANKQVLADAIGEAQDDTEDLHTRVSSARDRASRLREAAGRNDGTTSSTEVGLLREDLLGVAAAAGPALALAGAGGADGEDLEARLTRLEELSQGLDEDEGEISESEAGELETELTEIDEALTEFRGLTPAVVAAPFRGEAVRVAADGVELSDFYAPAVTVVLLQHLLVTALGLSLVREHALGTTELYRVAPLRPSEIVFGKYVAHLLVALLVGAALLALLILGLGVPMRGDLPSLALALLAVCLASAGLGFLVSLASRSDSQAVQYAMLILLLTVFFSGFILSLERFVPAVRWVAWLVPATYGVQLLRDVMLRGAPADPLLLAALAGIGLGLGVISWLWLKVRLRTR
jgi:ABC-2 type transport system permease protein